ncbi:MAG: type II CRISPR-associated endonuclease Cas1 [Bacilli bacterium]
MGWRTICINEAIRLNYKLNSLGVLQKDEIVWINLDEIDIIIVETLMCNLSLKLLSELASKGITMIVCGEDHMPIGNFISINDNQRTAKFNRLQMEWDQKSKQLLWQKIIKHKILLQMIVLYKNNKKDKVGILSKYIEEVELGDITNREGLAAKVYFHELFGLDFIRTRNATDIINSSLNYIYQVVRAKIAQEIISHGYISSLGIFHCSEYNYFGFADDLIEVYRPIIDYYVIQLIIKENVSFMSSYYKEKLLSLLYLIIFYDNKKQKLIESIKLFVISVTDCLSNKEIERINFPYFYDEN